VFLFLVLTVSAKALMAMPRFMRPPFESGIGGDGSAAAVAAVWLPTPRTYACPVATSAVVTRTRWRPQQRPPLGDLGGRDTS